MLPEKVRNLLTLVETLQFAEDGNFGESCEDCSVNLLPDPIWYRALGTTRPWLNCTCQGADASINMGKDCLPPWPPPQPIPPLPSSPE